MSGEESKSGFRPPDLEKAWSQITDFQQHVEIAGLMTMAPASDDPEVARPTFRGLHELQQRLAEADATHGMQLKYLSMGMSGDHKIAIEQGSTMVRIGSSIFGARNYN